MYFIDLDGTSEGDVAASAQTTVVAYDEERVVARDAFDVPGLAPPDRLGEPRRPATSA